MDYHDGRNQGQMLHTTGGGPNSNEHVPVSLKTQIRRFPEEAARACFSRRMETRKYETDVLCGPLCVVIRGESKTKAPAGSAPSVLLGDPNSQRTSNRRMKRQNQL